MRNSLKIVLSKKNLTADNLANKLNIPVETFHSFENGEQIPTAIEALKISKELSIDVEDIFTLEDDDWEAEEVSEFSELEVLEFS